MSTFDEKDKKELTQRIDRESSGIKEEVWDGLEQQLFSEDKGAVKRLKKKNRIIPVLVAVAAAILLAFTLQTDTGSAFIKGIKDMFVPEKEIIQNIEGQDEETDVNLNVGANSDYIIYIDEESYKMIQGEDADIITTLEPLPEKYPEVSMEIRQFPNDLPADLVKIVEADLKKDFPELREIEEVTEPVIGYLLHGLNGQDWDAKVVHTYVISNGKEGSFVITGKYFLEAAEGHGARFHHMLKSFEIVE